MSDLPHLDARGEAHMVDVGAKERTHRRAVAQGYLRVSADTIGLLSRGAVRKGDALAVARVAGIMAAKRTADILPLCHPVALSSIQVDLDLQPAEQRIFIEATVEARDRTGVEMEALTAVSVAALTLYDMLKAADRDMEIGGVSLVTKEGGRSGLWHRGVKVVPKSPPPEPMDPPTASVHVTAPVVSLEPPVLATPPPMPGPPTPMPTPAPEALREARSRVVDLRGDDPRLIQYLTARPIERAYMLGDLDPIYAEHCRWFGLPATGDERRLDAVLLLYQGLRLPAVLTSGELPDDIGTLILAAIEGLPRTFHGQFRLHHREVLAEHFWIDEPTTMIRMGLERADYIPFGSDEGVEPIGHRDTAAIMALYKHYPDNFFDPAQLSTGLYCGIREAGELISLAGVHVFSRRYDIAAIGNIVTHTDHRGRGLATRCVRHLLDRLFSEVSHVALNVQADNQAAIASYLKFGFTERYRFFEGTITR